jgi:hypothetical protein
MAAATSSSVGCKTVTLSGSIDPTVETALLDAPGGGVDLDAADRVDPHGRFGNRSWRRNISVERQQMCCILGA